MNLVSWFVDVNRRTARWLEQRYPRFFGSTPAVSTLKYMLLKEIKRQPVGARVLEVGGIDRPLLTRHANFRYVGLDVDYTESCREVYDEFFVQSVELPLPVNADLIFSCTLLEHVPDNEAAVKSISNSLEFGGVTIHYIPSKWHPYSVALRVLGPKVQKFLIKWLRPQAVELTGYTAFFDHCSIHEMSVLFEKAGLNSIEVKSFYRASDYFAFFLPAYLLVVIFENICSTLRLELLCSGFIISARKSLAE